MSASLPFKKWEMFAFGGLLLLVVLVVFPGLHAPLCGDDYDEVASVKEYRGWADVWNADGFGYFRPVKNAIFHVLQPKTNGPFQGIHLFGLACYFWGVAGVHLLARSLLGNRWFALACAAMWALAPTQVSTILWLSGANISLSAGFLCLALCFYDRARTSPDGGGRLSVPLLVVVVALGFAAQISYETAVALAPLALALDWYRGRRLFSRHGVMAVGLLGIATLGYLLLRVQYGCRISLAGGGNEGFSPDIRPWQVMLSAPWFLWQHLLMWLFPVGRIEFLSSYIWMRSAPPSALVSAWIGVVALVSAVFLLRKRLPLASFGIAWFLIALFPVSNFIPIGVGPISDYYTVIPSVGVVFVLADLARALIPVLRSGDRHAMIPSVAGLVLIILPRIAYVPFCFVWSSVWSDPVELWLRILGSRPCQFQVRSMISHELLMEGRIAESRELASRSAEEAPWSQMPWLNLAEGYFKEGNMKSALSHFEKLCAMPSLSKDTGALVHLRLGMIKGLDPATRDEAMQYYRAVLANPGTEYHARAAYELAKLYLAEHKTDKARATLERAINMNPDNTWLQDAYKRFCEGKGLPGPDEFLGDSAGASDMPMQSRH